MTEDRTPSGIEKLTAIFTAIVDEAKVNSRLAERITAALADPAPASGRKGGRRTPARLDPFEIFETGEQALRSALADLDVEQLKDVIAQYGMDAARLAMKWKTPDRLVTLIVDTVKARARKGNVFKAGPRHDGPPEDD
jgi:truncated hemoglobin YjbI